MMTDERKLEIFIDGAKIRTREKREKAVKAFAQKVSEFMHDDANKSAINLDKLLHITYQWDDERRRPFGEFQVEHGQWVIWYGKVNKDDPDQWHIDTTHHGTHAIADIDELAMLIVKYVPKA